MSKNEVVEILKIYLNLLKSEGVSVNKAFLYGSYLTGTANSDSDIDLMIVTEKEQDDYGIGKIWSLTKQVNSKIEPYIIGKNRFKESNNSPLIDLVKRTGLMIIN